MCLFSFRFVFCSLTEVSSKGSHLASKRGVTETHTNRDPANGVDPPAVAKATLKIHRGFSVKAKFTSRFNDKNNFSLEKQSTFPLLVFLSTL